MVMGKLLKVLKDSFSPYLLSSVNSLKWKVLHGDWVNILRAGTAERTIDLSVSVSSAVPLLTGYMPRFLPLFLSKGLSAGLQRQLWLSAQHGVILKLFGDIIL